MVAVLFAAFSGYLMWKAGEVPSWAGERFDNVWIDDNGWPGTGFWPFWLAGLMLLCSVWVIINALLKLSPPSQSDEPFLDWFAIKMLITVGGGVVAMVALTPVISMHFAVGLFMIYYVGILGRHGWKLTLTLGALSPVAIFLFFDIAMEKTLPKGYADPIFNVFYGLIYD